MSKIYSVFIICLLFNCSSSSTDDCNCTKLFYNWEVIGIYDDQGLYSATQTLDLVDSKPTCESATGEDYKVVDESTYDVQNPIYPILVFKIDCEE